MLMHSSKKHRDYLEFLTNCFRFCSLAILCKDSSFFFFFNPLFYWHSSCRAEGDKRGENSEDSWILCPYFNVPLMCEWIQIKIYLLFFPQKVSHVALWQMIVESNRANDIACSIWFPLFFWHSKLPYVLFKTFYHFYFSHDKVAFPSMLHMGTDPPVVPVGHFWFHLVLCMSWTVRKHPSLAVVFLWSIVRGYQHNTSLNILEHIPSNPEHTIIRGN